MSSGRYASLFPNQRISYWANSPETARAEIKKHGAGCSLLTFWAYDDRSSTFPTVSNQQKLRIIDGRKCGIQELIDKVESKEPLSDSEKVFMQRIINTAPDCIAYDSHAKTGGENFLFFEQGFKKLSLRELNLRLSKEQGANHCSIVCAIHCDYSPFIDRYGLMILPKARVCMDEKYLLTEEYKKRKEIYDESCRRFRPLIIL